MDTCNHDEQPDQLEQVIIGGIAGKYLVTAGEIAKAIRASGVPLGEGEHPNAADYRNRAERAEAECLELRAGCGGRQAKTASDSRANATDSQVNSHKG